MSRVLVKTRLVRGGAVQLFGGDRGNSYPSHPHFLLPTRVPKPSVMPRTLSTRCARSRSSSLSSSESESDRSDRSRVYHARQELSLSRPPSMHSWTRSGYPEGHELGPLGPSLSRQTSSSTLHNPDYVPARLPIPERVHRRTVSDSSDDTAIASTHHRANSQQLVTHAGSRHPSYNRGKVSNLRHQVSLIREAWLMSSKSTQIICHCIWAVVLVRA
jgi:hypothetical protein